MGKNTSTEKKEENFTKYILKEYISDEYDYSKLVQILNSINED